MKTLSTFFACLVFSICFNADAQEFKPKCMYGAWADRFTDNDKYNELLTNSCSEINAERFRQGLELLNQAIQIDSLANGGEINVFFENQRMQLESFINSNPQTDPGIDASLSNDLVSISKVENTDEKLENPEHSQNEILHPGNEVKNEPVNEVIITDHNSTIEVSSNDIKEYTNHGDPITENPSTLTLKYEVEEEINVYEPDDESVSFTEEEMEEFRVKGLQKVKQLENYLIQIGSKSTPLSMSAQSIENAVRLFDNESRTIEVSSVNSNTKLKRRVREYLQRVRNLNYDDVNIEWAELQYASDFREGRDGNFYAFVVFTQRFSGIKDNVAIYEDITTKRTEIILKVYEKALQGEITRNWDVFLGDISVSQTSAY